MDLKNLDKETLEKILRKVVQEELGRIKEKSWRI